MRLQRPEDVKSLRKPCLQLGLHRISLHAVQSLELLHTFLRWLVLHLFDVRFFLVRTLGRILDVALDLQLVDDELLHAVEVASAVVVLSLFVAVDKVLDGRVCSVQFGSFVFIWYVNGKVRIEIE